MKKTFINLFLIAMLFNLVSYTLLPERVAVHFGSGGKPDSWASREVHLAIFVGMYVFLFLIFYFAPALTLKTPAKWLNLPNKDYWLKEENKPRTLALITKLTYEFGIVMFLFFLVINILTVSANLAQPVRLNETLFFFFLAAFLVYTVYWVIKFFLAFKISKK